MYISLTSFTNPFSFFCIPENESVIESKNASLLDNYAVKKPKMDFTTLEHGQYIAVLHNNTWTRGIVSLTNTENQMLIWLVDYGMYLKRNLHAVYDDLPDSYKKLPSKVFEASLHGIVPVTKIIKDFCEDLEFNTVKSTTWVKGAVEEAKELIDKAEKIRFKPIALISTKTNDVVLGDLYCLINGYYVNIIDALEKKPMFLERDKEFYIENLQKIYSNRRHHYACTLKPELPSNIPTFHINDLNLETYNIICKNVPMEISDLQIDLDSELSSDDDTVPENDTDLHISLTPKEIQEYSTKYIVLGGEEVNVLNLWKNKARDFVICAKYRNLKSVGRATSKRRYEAFCL